MRRLPGLAVLFVMLCVSVPSYGYLLIYNVFGTVKGVNNAAKASISWKGYLVLNLDDYDSFVDANLIMYGKDSDKNKVYIEQDYRATDAHKLNENLRSQGSFVIFNFWCDTAPFDFEGFIVGKIKLKDIGLQNTQLVPIVMTGTTMVRGGMLLDADDEIEGAGTVSASLWAAMTKYANENGLTPDQVIVSGDGIKEGLIQTLQGNGYVAATLP